MVYGRIEDDGKTLDVDWLVFSEPEIIRSTGFVGHLGFKQASICKGKKMVMNNRETDWIISMLVAFCGGKLVCKQEIS